MKEKSTIKKVFTRQVVKQNKAALDAYDSYQKAIKKLDEAYKALGKKPVFKSINASTANTNTNFNEIGSTQKVQVNTRLA